VVFVFGRLLQVVPSNTGPRTFGSIHPMHARSFLIVGLLALYTCATPVAMGQGGKAFLKEGDALRKEQRLDEALEKYSLAIRVDPNLLKAYQARADVYELLGKQLECARDRRSVASLDASEPEYGAIAALAFLEVDSAAVAMALCEQALRVDPKDMSALQAKVRAALALGDLDKATQASDAALALKATTDTYYLHGLVRYALRDYKTAEFDLDKVLEWNHLYEPAYVALSEVQLQLYEQYSAPAMRVRTLEKAIEKCTRALELNPQSTDALFTRSKALALQKDYAKAIDDVSRCVALGRADREVYMQRARYYHGFGQHQNAVNDLNKVVLESAGDVEALLLRSECKEANLDLEGAMKDLELANKAMEGKPEYSAEQRKNIEASRVRIAQQVFEMSRESVPPGITVVKPYRKGEVVQVSASLDHVGVSGHVRDKSLLKAITVNGVVADFAKDEKDPEFVVSIPLAAGDQEILVQAVDVYDNFTTEVLRVERTEGVAPSIALTSPSTSGDRAVTVPAGKEELFIEGRVSDASQIRLISVNGVSASYASDQLDPDFSIKIDIKDRERFVVRAEDQFGNATEAIYAIVRKAEPVVVAKPVVAANPSAGASSSTGTTWVIYLENTNYRDFPALVGGGDMGKMQKAFANYSVQRTIQKKNLTKDQLERFFNIELRDLVRTNKVNTILVWYSGHGRTQNGKAYWVPVDARKDDVYSFFNYGPLKAQMQNYSETVGNTLVVSDAAGTDPSFYELTR
jgi:tetratricopeptide (TPR) repeat protein